MGRGEGAQELDLPLSSYEISEQETALRREEAIASFTAHALPRLLELAPLKDAATTDELIDALVARFDLLAPLTNYGYETDIKKALAGEKVEATCCNGSVLFAAMLSRAEIEHTLQVGLYWWDEDNAEECWEMLDRSGEDGDDALDEHHHWVEITDSRLTAPLRFDPNGELRHEPRLQAFNPGATEDDDADDDWLSNSRYEAIPSESKWSGISPDTNPFEHISGQAPMEAALALLDAEAVARSISE